MARRHSSGKEVSARENLRQFGSYLKNAPYYRVKFFGLLAGMVLLAVVVIVDL